jgi:hypothetical protein
MVNKLTLKEKLEYLEYAYVNCHEFHTDKLDCSISIARQSIQLTFSEIMKHFNNKSIFFCGVKEDYFTKEKYYDVGFRTEDLNEKRVELFLWLKVRVDLMEILINQK